MPVEGATKTDTLPLLLALSVKFDNCGNEPHQVPQFVMRRESTEHVGPL